jgi:hypothetical protein
MYVTAIYDMYVTAIYDMYDMAIYDMTIYDSSGIRRYMM